jgi:hypothetical protein
VYNVGENDWKSVVLEDPESVLCKRTPEQIAEKWREMKFVRQNSCKNADEVCRSDYECQWMLKVISSLLNTPVTVKNTQEPASGDIDDRKNTTLEQQQRTSQD